MTSHVTLTYQSVLVPYLYGLYFDYQEHITGAHLEPLRSVTPRQWEIDNLLRIRTLEQLTSAERTLQSLAQLLGMIVCGFIKDTASDIISIAKSNLCFRFFFLIRDNVCYHFKIIYLHITTRYVTNERFHRELGIKSF